MATTRRPPRPRPPSSLEARFLWALKNFAPDLPEPVREYRFAPPRRWRIDFAWGHESLDLGLLAVELEGGVHSRGRHVRGGGFEADVEKYNELTRRGWRLLRFTSQQLRRDPAGVVALVRECLGG